MASSYDELMIDDDGNTSHISLSKIAEHINWNNLNKSWSERDSLDIETGSDVNLSNYIPGHLRANKTNTGNLNVSEVNPPCTKRGVKRNSIDENVPVQERRFTRKKPNENDVSDISLIVPEKKPPFRKKKTTLNNGNRTTKSTRDKRHIPPLLSDIDTSDGSLILKEKKLPFGKKKRIVSTAKGFSEKRQPDINEKVDLEGILNKSDLMELDDSLVVQKKKPSFGKKNSDLTNVKSSIKHTRNKAHTTSLSADIGTSDESLIITKKKVFGKKKPIGTTVKGFCETTQSDANKKRNVDGVLNKSQEIDEHIPLQKRLSKRLTRIKTDVTPLLGDIDVSEESAEENYPVTSSGLAAGKALLAGVNEIEESISIQKRRPKWVNRIKTDVSPLLGDIDISDESADEKNDPARDRSLDTGKEQNVVMNAIDKSIPLQKRSSKRLSRNKRDVSLLLDNNGVSKESAEVNDSAMSNSSDTEKEQSAVVNEIDESIPLQKRSLKRLSVNKTDVSPLLGDNSGSEESAEENDPTNFNSLDSEREQNGVMNEIEESIPLQKRLTRNKTGVTPLSGDLGELAGVKYPAKSSGLSTEKEESPEVNENYDNSLKENNIPTEINIESECVSKCNKESLNGSNRINNGEKILQELSIAMKSQSSSVNIDSYKGLSVERSQNEITSNLAKKNLRTSDKECLLNKEISTTSSCEINLKLQDDTDFNSKNNTSHRRSKNSSALIQTNGSDGTECELRLEMNEDTVQNPSSTLNSSKRASTTKSKNSMSTSTQLNLQYVQSTDKTPELKNCSVLVEKYINQSSTMYSEPNGFSITEQSDPEKSVRRSWEYMQTDVLSVHKNQNVRRSTRKSVCSLVTELVSKNSVDLSSRQESSAPSKGLKKADAEHDEQNSLTNNRGSYINNGCDASNNDTFAEENTRSYISLVNMNSIVGESEKIDKRDDGNQNSLNCSLDCSLDPNEEEEEENDNSKNAVIGKERHSSSRIRINDSLNSTRQTLKSSNSKKSTSLQNVSNRMNSKQTNSESNGKGKSLHLKNVNINGSHFKTPPSRPVSKSSINQRSLINRSGAENISASHSFNSSRQSNKISNGSCPSWIKPKKKHKGNYKKVNICQAFDFPRAIPDSPQNDSFETYSIPKLKRPKKWILDSMYNYIIEKLEPQYRLKARVRAERFVEYLCDKVEAVMRKNENYKSDVEDLKIEMARLKIIKTLYNFHTFVGDFLPRPFKYKSVPVLRPFGLPMLVTYEKGTLFDDIL